MRRGVLSLFAVVVLAGCGTGDAGVRATGAAAATGSSTTEPAPPAPGAAEPSAEDEPRDAEATPPSFDDAEHPLATCSPDALTATDDGAGDPLFPELGNPDVDVQHYDIALMVEHDGTSSTVGGAVALDLVVVEDRPSITLDADGPQFTAVTVDGSPAEFEHDGDELRVTPSSPFAAGKVARVQVSYTAQPSPQSGADGVPQGWFTTEGGTYVLNEPDGASSWLPSNDHPSDKATYRFAIRVADGATAVANGALQSHDDDTWVWEEDEPMATYQIQLLTGDYEIIEHTGPHGLPLVHVVLAADRQRMQPYLDSTAAQVEFFEEWFGPYPLDRYGLAFTDSFTGLAMETLGRSMFSRDDFPAGGGGLTDLLLSHELAHQWYGNAVTLGRWQDIWLNESFATYGQWMWFEHIGNGTVDSQASTALQFRPAGATGDPAASDLFGYNSYDGGAVVLHALRKTIGEEAFFTVLRQWVAQFDGQSCTTGGFIDLAEAVSGEDLTEFFDTWLFATTPPSSFPH